MFLKDEVPIILPQFKKKNHLILKAGYLFYCVKNSIYVKGDCSLTYLLMLGSLAVATLDEPCIWITVSLVYFPSMVGIASLSVPYIFIINTLSAQIYQSHICTLLKFLGGTQRLSEGITLLHILHISVGEQYIVRQYMLASQ